MGRMLCKQEQADRRARLAAAQHQPPLFKRLERADAERDAAVRVVLSDLIVSGVAECSKSQGRPMPSARVEGFVMAEDFISSPIGSQMAGPGATVASGRRGDAFAMKERRAREAHIDAELHRLREERSSGGLLGILPPWCVASCSS